MQFAAYSRYCDEKFSLSALERLDQSAYS